MSRTGHPSGEVSPRRAFWEGMADMTPTVVGMIAFGMVTGMAAMEGGMSLGLATLSSIVILAGTAQLAMGQLMALGAPMVIIIASAVILNLRFAMYSAVLASHWTREPKGRRFLLSYILSDQGFALAINRYLNKPHRGHKGLYFLGGAVLVWPCWVAANFLGAWLGAAVPPEWSLDFTVWLIFMAMVRMSIRDRSTLVTALVAGLAALAAAHLPLKLGLLAATGVGVTAGLLIPVKKR